MDHGGFWGIQGVPGVSYGPWGGLGDVGGSLSTPYLHPRGSHRARTPSQYLLYSKTRSKEMPGGWAGEMGGGWGHKSWGAGSRSDLVPALPRQPPLGMEGVPGVSYGVPGGSHGPCGSFGDVGGFQRCLINKEGVGGMYGVPGGSRGQ